MRRRASWNKTKIGKEHDKEWKKTFWSHSHMRLFHDMKSNLYNVFIMKCVSMTNISIEHYMDGVIR